MKCSRSFCHFRTSTPCYFPASILKCLLVFVIFPNFVCAEMTLSPDIIKLKLCSSNNFTQEKIEIPTQFYDDTGEIDYILTEFRVAKDNILSSCSDGGSLSLNNFTSFDFSELPNLVNESDPSDVFKIQLRNTVVLSNGYLSLGHDSKYADYYSPEEYCIVEINGQGENAVVELKTCPKLKNRPVLHKCCPIGTIFTAEGCIGYPDNEKWDPEYFDAKTLSRLPESGVKPVFKHSILNCVPEIWEEDECSIEVHPLTDNRAIYIGAYRKWEFLDTNTEFCFDRSLKENNTIKRMMAVCGGNSANSTDEYKTKVSYIYMISMYIGAIFHLLTSLVYLITWLKQNIHGKTLCSCTVALFFMKMFMGTAHLLGILKNQGKTSLCIANGIGAQYFMISSFTWLLVVNIDLWWTFRSIRASGSKGFKRFVAYSGFGWGFPLLVTGVSVFLNFTFPCRTSRVPVPEYGERYCFVTPWAQGYFVYYILSVLIGFSFIFAMATLVGLYSYKKDANNLRSNKRAEDKQTVILFLKLGVVMGLSWIFEVISWAVTKDEDENNIVWVILDLYNALSAILIFIIFVCKRTTLNLLEQTHPIFKGITAIMTKFTSPFTGESSSFHTASTGVGSPSTGNAPSASQQIKAQKKSLDTVAYNKNELGHTNGGYQ